MINKTIKIGLLITLTIVLLGVVSAIETNTTTTLLSQDNIDTITNTAITTNEQNTEPQNIHKINKTKKDSNTKTAGTKKVYVKTSAQLINELTETDTTSTTKTINLKKGTYNINTNILLKNQKYTKIIINGNNSNIHGSYNTQFLNISSKYNVTINKLNIKYFKNSNAIYNAETSNVKRNNTGTIANYGKLTIKNCTFQNNIYNFTELNENAYLPVYEKNLNEKYPTGAGALYNKGMMTIEKTKFNNNNGYGAGAIYNKGTMTIKTSTFTNNYGFESGAIINKGTLTINKCDFISNKCDYYGLGAAIRNEKKLTVTNSNFKKNKATEVGGIFSFDELTVKNTVFEGNIASTSAILSDKKTYIQGTFKNNRADMDVIRNFGDGTIIKGNFFNNIVNYTSAISNWGKNVKLIGNFTNNTNIKQCGGVIFNRQGNIDVQGIFKNNKATEGGAIANFAKMYIHNSKFINNKAQKLGGAIYLTEFEEKPSINIYANFNNNSAPKGGAIYIDKTSKSIKINSNFTKNHATYGGAVYNNAHKAIITGIFNYNSASNKYNFLCDKGKNNKISVTPEKYKISKYGGSIYNKGNKVTISIKSTQKTKIDQYKTNIVINNIATVYEENPVTISGKFTDETGTILKNSKLIININGRKYAVKTDNNGKFAYKYKTTKTGTNKVTVSFVGNNNYIKTSTQKTFTVKKYKAIELYVPSLNGMSYANKKIVGNDEFLVWFQVETTMLDKGVHIAIEPSSHDSSTPLTYLMVDATFYFKNAGGKIIAKKFEYGYGDYMYHSFVSGYVPYKVSAKYRLMTQHENDLMDLDWRYNPKTQKWFELYV